MKKAISEKDVNGDQAQQIQDAMEVLLEPADVDGTRDYIIYCFNKAAAKYGRNGNIEEQAIEEAQALGKEFVNNFMK